MGREALTGLIIFCKIQQDVIKGFCVKLDDSKNSLEVDSHPYIYPTPVCKHCSYEIIRHGRGRRWKPSQCTNMISVRRVSRIKEIKGTNMF